ncbi:hypothetical protein BJY52DRAFT_596386 [Lactarius psammicola]|nr:hypothetical protein BJY52DRAFT_596386 [Lactarius psammicola]
MNLNVEATTYDMYIGRRRKKHFFIRIYFRASTTRIQYSYAMVKLQSHKKIIIESDSRRQASVDAKQAVLSSRDPRTVCMTEDELAHLRASFRVNRWPERAEKERLARLIGKSYEKVHHWFSNQRQKLANVEKALKHPAASETPLQPRNLSIMHMTGIAHTKIKPEEYGVRPRTQDAFMCKGTPERSDISVEDGARLLLEFVASVRAAHRTPSP